MKTLKRICLHDHTITDQEGTSFTLKRGEEYITSPVRESEVVVYSTYWVRVPVSLFAGEVEHTP